MMERLKRTLSVLMLLSLVLVVGCGSMVEVKIVKVATLEPVHALVISGASAPTSTPASPPLPARLILPTRLIQRTSTLHQN